MINFTLGYLLPTSLIGTGLYSGAKSFELSKKISDIVKNEKILLYRNDDTHFVNNISNITNGKNNLIVMKIPNNFIPRSYAYGEITLREMENTYLKKIIEKKTYNHYNKKYKTEYVFEEIKNPKKISKHVLFPNIFNSIYTGSNVKVLLSNNVKSSSYDSNLIIKKYEEIVQKNIPNYKSGIFTSFLNSLELDENMLGLDSDIYLLLKKEICNISTGDKKELEMIAFGDDPEKLLELKYSDDFEQMFILSGISIISILTGVGLFMFKI